MSASIRKALPSLINGLNNHLSKARGFMDKNTIQNLPEDKSTCITVLSEAEILRMNLETARNKVLAKDASWEAIIRQSGDDADELKRYDDFAFSGTGQLQAYMHLIESAEEAINYLNVMEKRIHEALNAIRQTETQLQMQAAAQQQQAAAQSTNLSPNPQATMAQARSRVHLPKLVLPKFSGKVTEWPKFWNLFHVNIDARADLSDSEKLSYLFTLLEGSAMSAIEGLSVQDDHYPIAIDQLKMRYERETSTTLAAHIAEVKRIPSCGGSIQQKRNTFDQCERLFRQMEAAGQDLSDNVSLGMEFLSKFPGGMIRELDQFHNTNVTTKLVEIRRTVGKLIAKAEVMNETIDSLHAMSPNSEHKKTDRPYKGNQPTESIEKVKGEFWNRKPGELSNDEAKKIETSVFLASDRTSVAAPRPCHLCSNNHFNSLCPVYATAQSRRKRLIELDRCTRCMGQKHHAKHCNFALRSCPECGGDHVTALCGKRYPETKHTTTSEIGKRAKEESEIGKPEPKPRTSLHKPPNGTNVSLISETSSKLPRGKTVLMTAWCQLINPRTGKTTEVRLILDSGSSRNYIADKAAERLELETETSENIEVRVFGSNRPIGIQSRVVNFNLKLLDGSVKLIEANTTPVISDASVTPNRLSTEERSILEPFATSLADKIEERSEQVEVLLGAANFWDIVTGPPFKSESNIKLIPSKFGILLAGTLSSPSQEENVFTTFFCLAERPREYPKVSVLTPDLKSEARSPDLDEYCKLEAIGIRDDSTEKNDGVACEKFQQTLPYSETEKRIDEENALLPTNTDGADRRLHSLAKKRSVEPTHRKCYQEVSDLQFERGIIEKVPQDDVENPKHDITSTTTEELKAIEAEVSHTAPLHSVLAGEPQADFRNIVNAIDLSRFSKLQRALRTTVIELKESIGKISDGVVVANDKRIASDKRVKSVQQMEFVWVLEALKMKKQHKLISLRKPPDKHYRDPRNRIERNLHVGEIVPVIDRDLPLSAWKITSAEHNRVRSAEMILPNKYLIDRSVAHLYPMELAIQDNGIPSSETQDNENGFTETLSRKTKSKATRPRTVRSSELSNRIQALVESKRKFNSDRTTKRISDGHTTRRRGPFAGRECRGDRVFGDDTL